jgi:hypothetical protein
MVHYLYKQVIKQKYISPFESKTVSDTSTKQINGKNRKPLQNGGILLQNKTKPLDSKIQQYFYKKKYLRFVQSDWLQSISKFIFRMSLLKYFSHKKTVKEVCPVVQNMCIKKQFKIQHETGVYIE